MDFVSESAALVLVDGHSGAGKTLHAGVLARETGATLVSLDEVYPGWDGLDAGSWHIWQGVIIPMSQGAPGRYRRWDWGGMCPGELVTIAPGTPLVIEGCGAMRDDLGTTLAHTLWIDAPEEVRRVRALARDGATFGAQWGRWAAQERRFFARHRGLWRADEVLTND